MPEMNVVGYLTRSGLPVDVRKVKTVRTHDRTRIALGGTATHPQRSP